MSAASELKARNGQERLDGMTMGHTRFRFTPSFGTTVVHESRVAIDVPVRLLAESVQMNEKLSAP